jgi:hypothetical protein
VASTHEYQSRGVRCLAEHILIKKSIAHKVCGQAQREERVKLIYEATEDVSSVIGSITVLRLQKPMLSKVHFSVDVCESGSLIRVRMSVLSVLVQILSLKIALVAEIVSELEVILTHCSISAWFSMPLRRRDTAGVLISLCSNFKNISNSSPK